MHLSNTALLYVRLFSSAPLPRSARGRGGGGEQPARRAQIGFVIVVAGADSVGYRGCRPPVTIRYFFLSTLLGYKVSQTLLSCTQAGRGKKS